MAPNENTATESVENQTETPSINETTPAEITPEQPQTTPEKPAQPRLAESNLEAAHAELPPLVTISNGTATETPANDTGATTAPAHGRRGLRRSATQNGTAAEKVEIGAVENPADASENLSGKFVNGYGDGERTERPRNPEFSAPRKIVPEFVPPQNSAPAENDTAQRNAPREFIPPVSGNIQKAKLSPEREEKRREEKRRERESSRNEREDLRAERTTPKREYFGERREDRASNWEPSRHQNQRGKLNIEPPKMVVREKNLIEKVRDFFNYLFGKTTVKTASAGEPEMESRQNRDHKHEYRRSHQRGDFRHGNRGDRPFKRGRNDFHRPHSRGGNSRPARNDD